MIGRLVRWSRVRIPLGALLVALSACTTCPVRDDTLRNVLEAQGFTDIKPGHTAVLGCSRSDTFGSTFEAKGPTGKNVHGEVCCGWVKDCTVRVSP